MLGITGFHSIALLVLEIMQINCGTLVYYTMKLAIDYYSVIRLCKWNIHEVVMQNCAVIFKVA